MNAVKAFQGTREEHSTDQMSSILALLNTHSDIKYDLNLTVYLYIKLYTSKAEVPTDNWEATENT